MSALLDILFVMVSLVFVVINIQSINIEGTTLWIALIVLFIMQLISLGKERM